MADWTPPETDKVDTSWSPPANEKVWAAPEGDVAPSVSQSGEFTKGLRRGAAETTGAYSTFLNPIEAEINKAAEGLDYEAPFDKKRIAQDAANYDAKIAATNQANPAAVPTIADIHGISDVGKYVAGQAGEMLPGMAAPAIAAAAVAALPEEAMIGLAGSAGMAIDNVAARAFLTKSAQAAAGVAMGAQTIPQTYNNMLSQGVDAPTAAILAGGATAGLMTYVPGLAIGKILGPDLASEVLGANLMSKVGITSPLVQKILSRGAIGAAEQGALGATAGAVNILAEHEVGLNPDVFTKDNLARVVNEGLQGAVAGAMFEGALAPLHGGVKPHELFDSLYKEKAGTEEEAAKVKPLNTENVAPPAGPVEPPPAGQIPLPLSSEDQVALVKARLAKKGYGSYDIQNPGWTPEQIAYMSRAKGEIPFTDADIAITPEQKEQVTLRDKVLRARLPDSSPVKMGEKSELDASAIGSALISDDLKKGISFFGGQLEDATKLTKEEHQYLADVGSFMQGYRPSMPDMGQGVSPDVLSKIKIIDQGKAEAALDYVAKLKGQSDVHSRDNVMLQKASLPDNNGVRTFTDAKGTVSSYRVDDAGMPHVMDVRSQPIDKSYSPEMMHKQRTDSAQDLINHLADQGHKEVKIDMTNPNTKPILDSLTKRGLLSNPREKNGFSRDSHATRFDIKRAERPSLQKSSGAPVFHTLQDVVDHHQLGETLKGVELTEAGQTKFKAIVDSLKRIHKELGGDLNLKFWDNLQTKLENSPVQGAQFLNMVHVALNDGTSFAQAHETYYHEIWHALERSGLITGKERALFDSNSHLLRDYMMKDGYLRHEDFDELLKTDKGREELRANAFGKMMVEQNAQGMNGAPSMFKSAFMKAKNFITRLKYALKGQDISKLQDLVGSMAKGKTIGDIHSDAMNHLADASLRKIRDQSAHAAAEAARQAFISFTQTMKTEPNYADLKEQGRLASKYQNLKKIADSSGNRNEWIQAITTPFTMAKNDPYFGLIFNHFRNVKGDTAKYMNTLHTILEPWTKTDKDTRIATASLMDRMRNSKLKGVMGADGIMEFKNETGVTVERLHDKSLSPERNKEINAAYKSLQDTMSTQHDMMLNSYKRKEAQVWGDKLLKKDFTLQDAKALHAKVTDILHDKEFTEEQKARAEDLVANMENAELLKKYEYIPHQRFGTYSYKIEDITKPKLKADLTSTGKPTMVGLHTIESGRGSGTYNEFQREREWKKIQSLYGDKSRYKITGANGVIDPGVHFSDAHPFAMNYKNIHDHIDPRAMNLELYSTLMHSSAMDPEAQAVMKDNMMGVINADAAKRNFGRLFTKSEGIAGYSTDWDRVIHTNIGTRSHMLANLDHINSKAILTAGLAQLQDDNFKKYTEDYMKYVGSPNDDYQTLRKFNYMWAMGGNLSSALVQLSTLPTMTLGQMSKYNPHVIQNMKAIAKWTKTASTYYAKMATGMSSHEALDHLVNTGRVTAQEANVWRRAEQDNQLSNTQKQEMMGKGRQETESPQGKRAARGQSVVQMLAMPVFLGEQITRAATFMATHEIMQKPEVEARMRAVHSKDAGLAQQINTNKDLSFAEHAGRYVMDQAHGVYGREGRAQVYRGLGGALIFPFMTFPHAAIERMIGEVGGWFRGATPEIKAANRMAIAVTLGALATTSGLMGLPGASAVSKLADEYNKKFNGIEGIGSERMLYEKIQQVTGSETAAKLATYGVGRAFLGTDIGRRFGLPELPGQNVIFNALGIGGSSPTAGYGVEGSVIGSIQRAFQNYQSDMPASNILGALIPGGAGNLFKAFDMATNGVEAGGVHPQTIITPEQISAYSIAQRLAGTNSDQVASLKEKFYAEKALSGGKMFQNAWTSYENQGAVLYADLFKAQKAGDRDGVVAAQEQIKRLITQAQTFAIENKTAMPPTLIRNMQNAGQQRITGQGAKPNKMLFAQSQELQKAYGNEGR